LFIWKAKSPSSSKFLGRGYIPSTVYLFNVRKLLHAGNAQKLTNPFSFKLSTVSLMLASKGMNAIPKLLAFSLET